MRRYRHRQALLALAAGALAFLLFVVLSAAVQGAGPSAAQPAPSDWTQHQLTAHRVAEQLRGMGYADSNPVIAACQAWWRSEADKPAAPEHLLSKEQRAAYPVAAAVWEQLRGAGLSEVCAAAILGSMAAECGGQTLDLDPYIKTGGFYGLCMWSLYYCPDVDGLGVPGQVDYLLRTLESNLAAGGGSAEAFLSMTEVRAAAKYFSDYYERPAVWASVRADNAETALAFFGG